MKKLIASIVAVVLSLFTMASPVMATSAQTTFAEESKAAILTGCAEEAEDGQGGGIKCIINLVIDILTVGIGIVGTIGITISGIQYMTAGGNEEQTRKAKRRIFEIVIGFAAYVLIYLVLKFLLPNF
ncbi:hypothetical protein IJ117_00025 [Candidatus Saccharibacteria bacterium]|nr:hypothetical protein [Candidatus Saccharibacteria bacterium]